MLKLERNLGEGHALSLWDAPKHTLLISKSTYDKSINFDDILLVEVYNLDDQCLYVYNLSTQCLLFPSASATKGIFVDVYKGQLILENDLK